MARCDPLCWEAKEHDGGAHRVSVPPALPFQAREIGSEACFFQKRDSIVTAWDLDKYLGGMAPLHVFSAERLSFII